MNPLHDRRFFAVVISSMDSMRFWDSDFDSYCYPCFCWQNLNMAHYCNQKTLIWTNILYYWALLSRWISFFRRWDMWSVPWRVAMKDGNFQPEHRGCQHHHYHLPNHFSVLSLILHDWISTRFSGDLDPATFVLGVFQVVGRILTRCIDMCILHCYIPVEAFVHYQSSSVFGPLCLRRLWSLPWCWPALLGRMKGWVNILHLLVSFC